MAEHDEAGDSFMAQTDYLDYDSIELLDEDFKDIVSISQLSDSKTSDKFTFTVQMINTMLTAYFIGAVPQYFFYWHTFKAVILLSYRWYSYKLIGFHYFLFDFCYFTNALVLFYIWSPWKLGWLFPVIFMFANGPLLCGIALWRNSLVPHSVDKMTSVFIHISPALTTIGIRWYSTPEQKFLLCTDQSEPGPSGCDHLGVVEMFYWPVILYLVWLLWYLLIVVFGLRKRVIAKQYTTSLNWMTERVKKGTLYRVFGICGDRHRKSIYFLWHTIYICMGICSACLSYHWMEFGIFMVLLMLIFASYNGATFYIDVFGHKYYEEKKKTK